MAIIKNKRQFFSLWEQGVLGNRTMLWRDLESALKSGVPKIGFRELNRGGGAWELSERDKAIEVFQRWKAAGRVFIMDGSVPNNHSVAQGEICRTERGLETFICVRDGLTQFTLHQLGKHPISASGLPPMRVTIAAGVHKHRGSLASKLLLDHYMDPSSRDDLDTLMEAYPDATIEFTCFNVNVGVFPHRNTIFWEVRDY